ALITASKAPGTTAAYQTAVSQFQQFCTLYQVSLSPSISVQALRGFVAYLAMPTTSKPKGLRYSTVQSYISGVKSWALDHGITVPPADEMGPVKVLLKGLKRLQHGRERAARLP